MTKELLELAGLNIEGTYLAVGKHGDGAKINRFDDGLICTSDLHHPVSNFAVAKSCSTEFVSVLSKVARERKVFNIYALPNGEKFKSKSWGQEGFRVAGALCLMISQETPTHAPTSVICAATFEERQMLTRFMALQFFSRQTSAIREKIALATAKAEVDLYHFGSTPPCAAVMVFRSKGMLGIYNLCVEASDRDRGFGSEMLMSLVRLAANEGRMATLQCDPSLEPWYRKRGFQSIGGVHVLTLEKKSDHAIL